jgi:mannose-6-phosphate isomerase-like protein (cupin superfamily)
MITLKNYDEDYGNNPAVLSVDLVTKNNDFFRRTVWTGKYSQMTIMSINTNDDIGLEVHEDHDQLLVIVQGQARVEMGTTRESLDEWMANIGDAIFVPAGTWHNIINSGDNALKLYSVYSPAEHQPGTVNKLKPKDSD